MGFAVVRVLAAAATLLAAGAAAAADPTTADCLASSENSLALRNQHKLREARAALLICAAPSCPSDIRAECARRVGEVNAAIPTIVFEAKDTAGNDLSAVRVSVDGAPLVERLEGTALSIDPGIHAFVFEAAGQPLLQKQLVIREGEKDRRERVVFGAANAGGTVAAGTVATAPGSTAQGQPAAVVTSPGGGDAADHGSWGTQKKVGVGLAAAGAAGLVTGLVFTIVHNSRASDFNNAGCSTAAPNDGPPGCQSKHDSVSTAETISIVGLVSGVVLGGVGAYLFFAAPQEVAAKVAFRRGSFSVGCLPSGDLGLSCGGRF